MSFYYQKNKEKILARLKKKYAEDKEFREKSKTKYRERYQNDENYKYYTLEAAKNRYYLLQGIEKDDDETDIDFVEQTYTRNIEHLNEKEILLEQLAHFRKYYRTTIIATQRIIIIEDIESIEKRLKKINKGEVI